MACHWIRLRNSADPADQQKSSLIDEKRQHPRGGRSRFLRLCKFRLSLTSKRTFHTRIQHMPFLERSDRPIDTID